MTGAESASSKFSFYLFADDINMLFADNILRSLETTVNNKLKNVCDWLTANKITLKTKNNKILSYSDHAKKISNIR